MRLQCPKSEKKQKFHLVHIKHGYKKRHATVCLKKCETNAIWEIDRSGVIPAPEPESISCNFSNNLSRGPRLGGRGNTWRETGISMKKAFTLYTVLCANAFAAQPIFDAITQKNIEPVQEYLQQEGDPNLARNHQWLEGPSEQNFTLVMEAARNGTPDIVKLLLEHDADPNAVTSLGRSPLMFAAERDTLDAIETVKTLMRHQADVNHRMKSLPHRTIVAFVGHEDSLGVAIYGCNVHVTGLLLEKGALVAHASNRGHLALARRMTDVFRTSQERCQRNMIVALLEKKLREVK